MSLPSTSSNAKRLPGTLPAGLSSGLVPLSNVPCGGWSVFHDTHRLGQPLVALGALLSQTSNSPPWTITRLKMYLFNLSQVSKDLGIL